MPGARIDLRRTLRRQRRLHRPCRRRQARCCRCPSRGGMSARCMGSRRLRNPRRCIASQRLGSFQQQEEPAWRCKRTARHWLADRPDSWSSVASCTEAHANTPEPSTMAPSQAKYHLTLRILPGPLREISLRRGSGLYVIVNGEADRSRGSTITYIPERRASVDSVA